jgi:O-antigen ligase
MWFLNDVNSGINASRSFGLMGDQLPWFLSFFAVYSLCKGNKYHFVFISSGILMGASLGATIVLILSILLFIVKIKKITISFIIKIGAAILLFNLVLLNAPSTFNKIGLVERFNEGDFNDTESRTTGQRYQAISNSIVNIAKKPIFGYQNYSLSMFNQYDHLLTNKEKGQLSYLASPNNQILKLICDYGLVGFILFVLFALSLMRIVKKKCLNMPPELYAFKQSSIIWLIVFSLFNQSATWFLPGSFLLVLIYLIVAINYTINKLYGVK